MRNDETKTSNDWYPIILKEYEEEKKQQLVIYDPDGWDRGNWQFSWYQEQITKEEFNNRLLQCTVMIKFLDEDRKDKSETGIGNDD